MANWKVVDADDLDGKLAAIGNAIRSKTNKSDMIPLQSMASEISMISAVGGRLSVKVSAGAKCTISKGAKSYTSTADSSGVAVFSGIEGGTWTITCEKGEAFGTGQVAIKTDFESSISISGPVLYYKSDEAISATGGWGEYAYHGEYNDIRKYADYMQMYGYGGLGTNNKINFRNYTKLYFTAINTQYDETADKDTRAHILSDKNIDLYNSDSHSLRVLVLDKSRTGIEKTYAMDIGGIGNGYIAFGVSLNNNIKIKKVWLGF